MNGGKFDAVTVASVIGAVGLSWTDINAILVALALMAAFSLSVIRIIHMIKHWNDKDD